MTIRRTIIYARQYPPAIQNPNWEEIDKFFTSDESEAQSYFPDTVVQEFRILKLGAVPPDITEQVSVETDETPEEVRKKMKGPIKGAFYLVGVIHYKDVFGMPTQRDSVLCFLHVATVAILRRLATNTTR
jgi:hypothetical protein